MDRVRRQGIEEAVPPNHGKRRASSRPIPSHSFQVTYAGSAAIRFTGDGKAATRRGEGAVTSATRPQGIFQRTVKNLSRGSNELPSSAFDAWENGFDNGQVKCCLDRHRTGGFG